MLEFLKIITEGSNGAPYLLQRRNAAKTDKSANSQQITKRVKNDRPIGNFRCQKRASLATTPVPELIDSSSRESSSHRRRVGHYADLQVPAGRLDAIFAIRTSRLRLTGCLICQKLPGDEPTKKGSQNVAAPPGEAIIRRSVPRNNSCYHARQVGVPMSSFKYCPPATSVRSLRCFHSLARTERGSEANDTSAARGLKQRAGVASAPSPAPSKCQRGRPSTINATAMGQPEPSSAAPRPLRQQPAGGNSGLVPQRGRRGRYVRQNSRRTVKVRETEVP
jgi:hypothetical protein